MGPIEQIRATEKKYSSLALTISIFAGLGFILLSMKPVGKGLILGTLFSVFNFIMMGETLPGRLGVSEKKATLFSGISILFRYVLLAVPVICAIKMDRFNLPATIVGLLMIQILMLAEQLINAVIPGFRSR
ncbi:MAG: ATP synthase subunit I [Deltaproteobacteria bacterium]|nr:ATP synthase subunit I [Deltaproteobacteria bacterium]